MWGASGRTVPSPCSLPFQVTVVQPKFFVQKQKEKNLPSQVTRIKIMSIPQNLLFAQGMQIEQVPKNDSEKK
jgi:hypothetical protein